MKQHLAKEMEQIQTDLKQMSVQLYENPELGDQEFKSMRVLVDFLKEHGFEVEVGIVDRPTAFQATFSSSKPGPTISYLAEYDALPGVGHGCGHNLIGTMSCGAAVALSKLIEQTGGTIIVFGTPAEETNGAKVPLSEKGYFDEVDAALMVHPGGDSHASGESLAMDAVQFAYTGRSSHAAAAPEKGINALDSVIQLFNGINALREHLPTDVRIHGIISEGGQAANVVPDYAEARFYLRAKKRETLDAISKKVFSIAEGAAQMTGSTLAISNYELSYDDMRTNQTLSEAFTKNLIATGVEKVHPPQTSFGSLDMGNVSQKCPAIHPYIGMDNPNLVAHTKEFAETTVSEAGQNALVRGALALAFTGYDLLTNKELYDEMKREFS
ncbi:amidohydrolase [Halalkalibacillus sediminis]|uniref:Peptidase M20 domain-containing protein 2 n=1 Tax=Halalkalibacillus sediminis TaxID=2018042 RepID=A0A2I0QVQ6_9BACI|nr:M20 family metallopeptidase [Halalkalibacillus sediminis]PKR78421.1 amidohydrolase [Halalkalibacillus sediminis]